MSARVDSFGDGLIMTQTMLHLELLDVEKTKINNEKIQKNKKININENFKNKKNKEAIVSITGEDYADRKMTKTVAIGTIYGRKQDVKIDLVQNSFTGINPMMLTTEGMVNPPAVIKKLKEIVPSVDLREQRLNRLFNAVITRDFYENYSALGFKMEQVLNLLEMYDKNSRYTQTTDYSADVLRDVILTTDDDLAYQTMVRLAASNGNRISYQGYHPALMDIVDEIRSEFKELDVTGQAIYSKRVTERVWHMFDYDDGHSQSTDISGERFGFVGNCMAINMSYFDITPDLPRKIVLGSAEFPTTDATLDALNSRRYYINCAGMNSQEVAVLNWLFNDQERQSPFLVDQPFSLGIDDGEIYALHCVDYTTVSCTVTRDLLVSVYRKFMTNHRCYEDFLAAHRMISWWVAQPGPETIESYLWLDVCRTQNLPRLGMRRAYFSFLTEGEAVSLTNTAISLYREMGTMLNNTIFESFTLNTLWYWGEFFLIHNKTNVEAMLKTLHGCSFIDMDVYDRATAIASAVLGRAIPVSGFDRTGVFVTQGLEEIFTQPIPIGSVRIDHIADWGYEFANESVTFHNLTTPGGTTLIVGLAGELIRTTPYSSLFTTDSAMKYYTRGIIRKALSYNDLWAIGVVSRWQGYDLTYQPETINHDHTIFAANNVMVAMPPLGIGRMDEAEIFKFRVVNERDHVFGSMYPPGLDVSATYAWKRLKAVPLARPNYKAPPATQVGNVHLNIRTFKPATELVANFRAYVTGNYDIESADFRVGVIRAGVSLQGPNDPSLVVESETPINQLESMEQ
jgi:hypothetical protein